MLPLKKLDIIKNLHAPTPSASGRLGLPKKWSESGSLRVDYFWRPISSLTSSGLFVFVSI